jgi:hypothetical protein
MDTQGLISALEDLRNESVVRGFPCSVGEFVKQLDKTGLEAFNATLEDKNVGTVKLHAFLIQKGFNVSKASLYNHRRKGCRCFQ